MFSIDEKTKDITVTRGNSFELCVTPYIGSSSTPYIPENGDRIYFTVKGSTGRIYIQKEVRGNRCAEDGTVTFSVYPQDTVKMKPFTYQYDVLLVKPDENAYTFIGLSKFTVLDAAGIPKGLEVEVMYDDEN